MAIQSKTVPETISLDLAYKHVRDWYLANLELAPKLAQTPFVADRARTLITSLSESLSQLEMRAVLHEVIEGLLDWGAAQSDGQFLMSDYARAGLESSGGERFTMDERSRLQGTSLARVLIQDYHKDPEEQRTDGYSRYDASSSDAGPTPAESQTQGSQRDADGVAPRGFPSGAPEQGFSIPNNLDTATPSVAQNQNVAPPNLNVPNPPPTQPGGANGPGLASSSDDVSAQITLSSLSCGYSMSVLPANS
jgi:hypothetical protein